MKKLYRKWKFYRKVNWRKTLYFNFKKFPWAVARKLPVFFYGKVTFTNISGNIVINAPIETGMIGFGQVYEKITVSAGTAEINIQGTVKFNGYVQFGKDYLIYVAENATLEMGNMSSLGNKGKIACTYFIKFGNYTRIGFESQLLDNTFHQLIDVSTNELLPTNGPIVLNDYNYFGNRVSIMQDTVTPNYCTVASNSLCNTDYTGLGNNILIGGIPARLLRENITRDWEAENKLLDQWMLLKNFF